MARTCKLSERTAQTRGRYPDAVSPLESVVVPGNTEPKIERSSSRNVYVGGYGHIAQASEKESYSTVTAMLPSIKESLGIAKSRFVTEILLDNDCGTINMFESFYMTETKGHRWRLVGDK